MLIEPTPDALRASPSRGHADGQMCIRDSFYRDVRLFRIFEGTSQIQQLVIAREVIKANS